MPDLGVLLESGRYFEASQHIRSLPQNSQTIAAGSLARFMVALRNHDWKGCSLALGKLLASGSIGPVPWLGQLVRGDHVVKACARVAAACEACAWEAGRGRLLPAVAYLNPMVEGGLRIALGMNEEDDEPRRYLLDLEFPLQHNGRPRAFQVILTALGRDDLGLADRVTTYLGPQNLMDWAESKINSVPTPWDAVIGSWIALRPAVRLGNMSRHTFRGPSWPDLVIALDLTTGASIGHLRECLYGKVGSLIQAAGVGGIVSLGSDLVDQINKAILHLAGDTTGTEVA